jgi:hypothetical protein
MYPERGGVKTPRSIIDKQVGAECGFEALENVIQLVHLVGNDISETDLKPRAILGRHAHYRGSDLLLDMRGSQPLLAAHGIASTWVKFDRSTLVAALRQNRVAIAVVNPYYLNPKTYSLWGDLHAIVLTNFVTDPQRKFLAYTGIDSNSGGEERRWAIGAVENGIVAAGLGHVLITDGPIHPLHWANYELLTRGDSGYRIVMSKTA